MDKSRILALLVAIGLSVTACTFSNENVVNEGSASPGAVPKISQTSGAGDSLVFYNMYYHMIFSDPIKKLKEMHPEIRIEEKVFEDFQEFQSKLLTGLMSGNGPDVVATKMIFIDGIEKAMDSGTFIDLNPYFEKDSDINPNDFLKVVMDWGVRDGRRYIVPISFDIPSFTSVRSAQEKNAIQFDRDDWTWESLSRQIVQFDQSYGEEKLFFYNQLSINEVILSSGIDFVDYDKKEARFDTPEFIKILEYSKAMYPCISDFSQKYYMRDQYKDGYLGMYADGKLVACPYPDLNPLTLAAGDREHMENIKEPSQLFTLPTLDGSDKLTATPVFIAGVCEKCTHKEAAFDFIKLLLSDGTQKNPYIDGIPVNIPVYEWCIDQAKAGSGGYGLSKELEASLDKAVKNVVYCKGFNVALYEIIDRSFQQYLNNKITVEDCARQIQEMAEIYLSE